MLFKDVQLRTRRALLLYKVYGVSALLVLNRWYADLNVDSVSVPRNTIITVT